MKWILAGLAVLFLTGCDYEEVQHETGYKGKARINPWLAAERFAARQGCEVVSTRAWKNPEWDDSVFFVPAAILSNESFTRKTSEWVVGGGHLVVLVDHAEAEWNDWHDWVKTETRLEPALHKMLEDAGIEILTGSSESDPKTEIVFDRVKIKVAAGSDSRVKAGESESGVFASVEHGEGRMTVLTDARIFRNRRVGEHEHALLLGMLIDAGENVGRIVFLRGSGISLWTLVARYLWPVLIGLGVLVFVWLWKSFSRFGPLEAATAPSPLRGYDHHLEALGDFQWRLDKGAALLAPLRHRIVEAGQRFGAATGRRDEDFFQLLAERAGLPRERVVRALTEAAPSDATVMTRTSADIQRLLEVL